MRYNKECAAYVIDLIRAVMQETEIPEKPESLSLQELYGFAKLHNVEALLYHGLCQTHVDLSDPVWQNWENRAGMLLAQGIVQLAERDELFSALTAAGIPLLPFKGCWLKEMYPNMEYRQMADLDVLIPRDRALEARKILFSLGYQPEAMEDAPNHAGYRKPPYTEVELHISLLVEDNGYYDDVWNRVRKVEGYPCLFRFSAEDEYIFYILHLNKHLEDNGIGIRSVLDSVVFRDVFPDMDRQYLKQELQKLSLWQKALEIETLADCWFKTGAPVPESVSSLADFLISAGSFGNMEIRSRHRLEKIQEQYKNPILRTLVYWIGRICRPLKEMQLIYPILEKLPVLLPVFWILRALQKLFRNPRRIINHVRLVFGRKEHD